MLAMILGACSGSGSGADPFADSAGGETISLVITSPASGGTLETPDETVTLAGTAASSFQIVSVSWVSDRGGEGEASGTESWEAAGIPLQMGENAITLIAEDSSGGTTTRTVTIKRETGAFGSVTLNWDAPTVREDGTPLTNLAGYFIRYGRMSKTHDYKIDVDNPGLVSYVVENLKPGKWYFTLTAYDITGLESDPSNEVARVVP